MQEVEFLACLWGEQQVALTVPWVTASDGGPGYRPVTKILVLRKNWSGRHTF